MPVADDFLPAASLDALKQRWQLLRSLREFFHQHEYWEVETPLLSRDCCVDAWIDPFALSVNDDEIRYLQTSPEFCMKRLLVAGADRIFEITRSFRRDEVGPRHNPEFTIVEWYARQTDHHDQMTFVEELIRELHRVSTDRLGVSLPALPSMERISYRSAFEEFAGVSPMQATTTELAETARATGVRLPRGIECDRDGLLNLLLAECIEPQLAKKKVVFLYDYPASQAALARLSADDATVSERFELYLDGVEICNGYHELTDAAELRERMTRQNALRIAAGKPQVREDSRLIEAMQRGLPPCAGVALGFDRLAMWCLGYQSIQDVLAFPADRA